MATLALFGGTRAVPRQLADPQWPVVTAADEQAVLRTLRSGRLSATADGEPEIPGLEREFAELTGAAHCVAISSGTTALQLALAALDVPTGSEVPMPALSMNATALAVLAHGAKPVFVDIDPRTYTMDPILLAASVSARTGAVLPVHLHGLPADMEAINTVARRHGVPVIEDAAQAHGARYHGICAGVLGDAGCFSLHPSKNLPSCGEGGLVTTDSAELHARLIQLRLFGERLEPGCARTYVALRPGINGKLSPLEAAFTREQLRRFDEHAARREPGILALLDRLGRLPGIVVPAVPEGSRHAWHILRLRFEPAAMGIGDVPAGFVRRALHRVLRAEGVPVSRYQTTPLPAQPAFARPDDDEPVEKGFPVTAAVLEDSLCLQRRHLNPDSAPALAAYADGFEKVWSCLAVVGQMARSLASAR